MTAVAVGCGRMAARTPSRRRRLCQVAAAVRGLLPPLTLPHVDEDTVTAAWTVTWVSMAAQRGMNK